ncbi:MAG TPA: 50S ribosomal protein L9 [Candidatus Kapabacteria bacterium]|jgi:large subunit ribosomal protein L9|nr:50S ribosomal protein L9 [Candidatus Kapabacteria bacterium]
MPKTEVILTHNVIGLGAESDQVKVAAGYARNYLFPQGLAVPLNSANKRQIEALQKRRVDREAKELHSMTELASTLSKLTLVLHVKTGEDGKMFGSVTAGTIADELRHQYDAQLDKRKINLQHPIKSLGEHEVPLHLHHDVDCTLKVRVESSTPLSPEVQAQLAAAKASAKEAAKEEARDERKGEGRGGKGARAEKGEGRAAKGEAKPEGKKADKAEKSEKSEKKPKKA